MAFEWARQAHGTSQESTADDGSQSVRRSKCCIDLANQWISELIYVFPIEPADIAAEREAGMQEWQRMMRLSDGAIEAVLAPKADPAPAEDLLAVHFRDCEPRTKLIELKHYATRDDAVDAAGGGRRRGASPLRNEPQVPFDAMAGSALHIQGITHVVVAQSPAYAPESADALLAVLADYFRLTVD